MSFDNSQRGKRRLRSSPRTPGHGLSESSQSDYFEQHSGTARNSSFTPYRNRNLSLGNIQQPAVSKPRTKHAIKKLECLANINWHLFTVSPLFNWSYKEASLKKYARCMSEKLTAQYNDETSRFVASYSDIPNLKLSNSDDIAVEIKVEKVSDTVSRLVYHGILLSWGASESDKPPGCTFLPLLLSKGLARVAQKVHLIFQEIHDCFVAQKYLEGPDIRCLVVGHFANVSNHKNQLLELKFVVPKFIKTGHCVITLPAECLHLLWECIHSSGSRKWSTDEVNFMWDDIHQHINILFGINLDKFVLQEAKLPHLKLSHQGVNVKNNKEMHLILTYLMSECYQLESVAPTLHFTR